MFRLLNDAVPVETERMPVENFVGASASTIVDETKKTVLGDHCQEWQEAGQPTNDGACELQNRLTSLRVPLCSSSHGIVTRDVAVRN
jgi:hypothetical protein